MGRNKRERKRKNIIERRNRRRNWTIAAVLGLVSATTVPFVCSPKKEQERPAIAAEERWEDYIFEEGVSIEEIAKHSPTYMSQLKRSREKKFDPEKPLRRFYKSRRYSDYNTFLMGCMYGSFSKACIELSNMHKKRFMKLNGFQDAADYAHKYVRQTGDEEALRKFLDIAFFLTRSTYAANKKDIDVLKDDFEQKILAGASDCETNSAFTLFNFAGFAEEFGKMHLLERLRMAEGFSPETSNTGVGHVWIEAMINNEWTVIECNSENENYLKGQEFDPKINYWRQAVRRNEASKGYKRLIGLSYDPKQGRYSEVVFALPGELEKEMRMNGWKR